MIKIKGKQTAIFESPVYVHSYASVVGPKEGQGPLGSYFDIVGKDDMWEQVNWESAESKMQSLAIETALKKGHLTPANLRYLVAGDLLGQLMATSFGIKDYEIPLLGVYGACSTMGESINIASLLIDGGFGDYIAALTSSHFGSAEKQFRFPLDYGTQRPLAATWTVTGSACVILSRNAPSGKTLATDTIKNPKNIIVRATTTGKIVDYGIKDSMNMGACMAPAAADTIFTHLTDMNIHPGAYDKIITGDLGMVGRDILLDILDSKQMYIKNNYMDCGIEIYYNNVQDTHSGGSGCGCSATTLAGYIFSQLLSGEWKKVLFVPTGALLSPISFNEGSTVPGIAHAIVFEAE